MPEFDIKLNYSDGGLSEDLKEQGSLYDKLTAKAKEYGDNTSKANRSIGVSLNEVETKAKAALGEFGKKSQVFTDLKKNAAEVAIAISKDTEQTNNLLAAFRKLNELEANGVVVSLEDVEREIGDVIAKVKLTDDQFEFLKANVREVTVELASLVQNEDLTEVATKASVLTKEFASAKSELRALNNAINSGDLQGDDLQTAIGRAAELTDRIGDNREQINKLASDTRGIDTLSEGLQAVAVGFQITQGVIAVFGDESEEVQEALLKLNGVMAITNGLQQAHALLLQNSNISMLISSGATKAYALATGLAVGFKKLLTGQLKLEAITTGAATAAQLLYSLVVGKSTGVMKLFRIALASTGVGLLVIGIGLLVSNWDKLNSSMGFFNKLANGAKAIVAGLMVGLSGIGNVISTLFTGGGVSAALAAATKLGQDMAKATNDAFAKENQADSNNTIAKYTDGLVSQQKKKLDLIKAQGKEAGNLQSSILQNELVGLKLRGAKTEEIEEKQHELAISIAEREKEQADKRQEARDKANDSAQKSREKELQLQQKYKDEIIKLNDDVTNAQRANALAAIDDTNEAGKIEKLELQKKYDQEDLKLREEQSLKIARTLEEKNKVIELYKQLEISLEQDYEAERIKVVKEGREADKEEFARIEAEKLKDKADVNAATIEQDRKQSKENLDIYLAEVDRKIKYGDLEVEAKEALEREKLEVTKAYLIAQRQLLGLNDPGTSALSEQIKDIEAQLNYMDSNVTPRFKSIGETIDGYLKDAFNINDEQIEALKEGFSQIKDEILGLVQSGFEAELGAIEASIKAREDKISDLDDLIEEELERKEAGDSNYYDSIVAQKAKEEQLLIEENAKKTEIQKTQLKVEAGIAAAQQVQSLITAVANITKDGSKLGVFGIPLIAAGIISLFAIYRNFKNQAKSLGQTAYKGGKISEYLEPGQTARSDRPGYGEGHRVEGTNLSIGADEYLVNAVSTSSNLPFLDRFNDGEWDNINLSKLIDTIPDRGKIINIYEKNEISKKTSVLSEHQVRQIIEQQTERILEADRRRPIVVNKPNGDTEIVTYTKSGAKKVKVLKKRA